MSNIYDIDHYINQGYTKKEAESKIADIKRKASANLSRSLTRKRMNKYGITDISINEYEKLESEVLGIENSVNDLTNLYKIVVDISLHRNISILEALNVYKNTCLKFSKFKRPMSSTDAIAYAYGKDSQKYKDKLKTNKSYSSCNFGKFSNSYDDKQKARKDFDIKYGSNNIDHIMNKYGVTEKQAEDIIKQRSDKGQKTLKSKPQEELDAINKRKALTLDNYIQKYGKELGTQKYRELCDKRNGQCSLEYYIEKYGEYLGRREYERKKGKHNSYYCKEYWISRGYDKQEAEDKVSKLMSLRPNFSLDYCIEKYGFDKGYKVWKKRNDDWQNTLKSKSQEEIDEINAKKAITLERMISKYGEEQGTIRYRHWLSNVGGEFSNLSSKSARMFFLRLYKRLAKRGIVEREDCYFEVGDRREYCLYNIGKRSYYDFTIPKIKLIVEYNGVAFHAKEGDHEWKSAFGMTYEESIERDSYKKKLANERGFEIFYVWEDENESNALDRIFKIVTERYNEVLSE